MTRQASPESTAVASTDIFPRDTLVVEATFPDPIGSDEAGAGKVRRYLYELAEIVGAPPLCEPVAHLSPKYGFSGWAPLQGGSALHLYAWDEKDRDTSPFISVDVSTPGAFSRGPEVIEHLRGFVGAGVEKTVSKTLRNPAGTNERTWREVAPHIFRQRLAVAGRRQDAFQIAEIQSFFRNLCRVLKMDQLSDPLVQEDAAWMHWETSGTVASWKRGKFSADIYTCKAFDPADAVRHTREALSLTDLISREF